MNRIPQSLPALFFRTALVLAAMAPIASAETVSEKELSLSAETTFFLFRDDFDHLQTPARLPFEEGRALYTLLTNQSGTPTYSLGLRAPVGPGTFAFFASGTTWRSESTELSEEFDASLEELVYSAEETRYNYRSAFDVYAGYGLSASGMNLGVGLRLNLNPQKASTDQYLSYGGANAIETDTVDNITETVTGEYTGKNNALALILSAAKETDNGAILQADLTLGRRSNALTATMDEDRENMTSQFDGLATGTLSQNLTGPYVGLEVNPELPLNERLGLEVFGAIEVGKPDLSEDSSAYRSVRTAGPVQTINTTDTLYTATKMWEMDAALWAALRLEISPNAELRLGAGYRHHKLGWEITEEVTTGFASDSPEVETRSTEGLNLSETDVDGTFFAPVALEMLVAPRLVLRAAAQYELYYAVQQSVEDGATLEVDGEPVEIDEERLSETASSLTPALHYALGLSFRVTPRARLELMVTNAGANRVDVGAALDLFASATVEW